MTNAHGTSFFLYKKLNKCRTPCLKIFCQKKETLLKMTQISNILFFEINYTVVEFPCMMISTKERRQMTKMPIYNDFLKQKKTKMTNAHGTSFFLYKKLNKYRTPSLEISCKKKKNLH